MPSTFPAHKKYVLLVVVLFSLLKAGAQTNLLLNGGFEEVNTCTEYNAECGVEAWFYLKDVKAQMLSNEINTRLLGSNSFGIFYNWLGDTSFTPIIGTLLPCGLQKNKSYTFKGIIQAKLNANLDLKPGICTGERFYVPQRPFSKNMTPDTILQLAAIPATNFYRFEYSFTATGNERYLTFGIYVHQDYSRGKKQLIGVQTVAMVLDGFELVPSDPNETICTAYAANKEKIYNYNFRHKAMDYGLYGKGQLDISIPEADSNFFTRQQIIPPPPVPDTLKLGDVFFDFNKALLKPSAVTMLQNFFLSQEISATIDSVYVEGHTDSIGSDKRNMTLSLQRCESIRQWLLLNSVLSAPDIQVHPFGKTRPVATNSTPEGRAQNRRVELIIFRRKWQG